MIILWSVLHSMV